MSKFQHFTLKNKSLKADNIFFSSSNKRLKRGELDSSHLRLFRPREYRLGLSLGLDIFGFSKPRPIFSTPRFWKNLKIQKCNLDDGTRWRSLRKYLSDYEPYPSNQEARCQSTPNEYPSSKIWARSVRNLQSILGSTISYLDVNHVDCVKVFFQRQKM